MHKYFKGFLCLLLVILLLLSITACNPLSMIGLVENLVEEEDSIKIPSRIKFTSGLDEDNVSEPTEEQTVEIRFPTDNNTQSSTNSLPTQHYHVTETEPDIEKPTISEAEIDFSQESVIESFSPLSKEEYYYASRLSDRLKPAYNKLRTAAATRTVGMISLGKLTAAEVRLLYVAVKNDFPEYFWLSNSYIISQNTSGDTYIALETANKIDGVSYLVDSDDRISMSNSLKATVHQIYSGLLALHRNKPLTTYDVELFIHDWLCENVTYNTDAVNNLKNYPQAFTAYGALVERSAVCEGYSRAAQLLFNIFGIKSGLVSGVTNQGEGHMWNMVYINNQWYHLDITWDDSDDGTDPYHFFFNMSDRLICRDRTIDPPLKDDYSNYEEPWNYDLPTCNSLTKNYFVVNSGGLSSSVTLEENVSYQVIANILSNSTAYSGYTDFAFLDSKYTIDSVKKTDFKSIFSKANKVLIKNSVYMGKYSITMCESGFRISYEIVHA